MRPIAEVLSGDLNWQQRGDVKLEYDLMADGEPVASLHFRSTSGSLATGESGDGCWTFKRVGIWQVRVTTRPCGSNVDIASFRYDGRTGDGMLVLSDNRRYLAHATPSASSYDFRTEDGRPLLRLRSEGMMRHAAAVEVPQAGAPALAAVPWLVLLGWYLTVITYIDAGAASAG